MAGGTLDPFARSYAARTSGMTVSEIRALFAVASRPEVVSLAGGMPYTAALPLEAVAEAMGDMLARRGATALQYGSGQGDPALRELICAVMALEGITASAQDVVVTVGSQQGLDLLTKIFCDPGDIVLAEGPSYVGALSSFAAYQAEVVHVAMDNNGLIPPALREALGELAARGRRAKFLYTVPNFHNPAGVTLSPSRREEILDIATEAELLVVEDNPYGLLGFDDDPAPALRARDDRVLYLGSFSKTFAPGVRVGWVLAPNAVRDKLVLASEAAILCPPMLSQLAVADYLQTQPWQEQIKVFRELYRERRDTMLLALARYLPGDCHWTRPAGGFYVWVTMPAGIDTLVMQPRSLAHRVAYVPGVGFYADGNGTRQMRLSYCFPEPVRIIEGVRRLAAACEEELDLQATFGASPARSSLDALGGAPSVRNPGRQSPGPDLA